jgi:predicted permease
VGPDYFAVIGARLVRGRGIEARDDGRSARVAVVNEAMARRFFRDRDPVGAYLRLGDTTNVRIVGVAADVRDQSLRDAASPRFYLPVAQTGPEGVTGLNFEVRTAGDPARLAEAVRREIRAAEPSLRVYEAAPLTRLMRDSIAQEQLLSRLAAIAGALALALAALGLYGVMTYTIVRRTSEFGLRMALGAQPADVTRMVLREAMTLYLVGIAAGLPIALGAVRLIRHQLVGVAPVDPPTIVVALLVLGASAALAAYQPASRAARVAPQVALRDD